MQDDAWNRLMQVKNASDAVIATYAYDGLHRRIRVSTSQGLPGPWSDGLKNRQFFYDASWRMLQERLGVIAALGPIYAEYVWDQRYIDVGVR